MAEEKLVDAVIFVCPHCGFEEFESAEELCIKYNFDGHCFRPLPKFECHGCHRFRVKAKYLKKIPASWLEPF